MNIRYIHPADQLVMFMRRIYDKGLTTMSGGNLSIRDGGDIWITPAGVDKGALTRRDMVCVKPDGSIVGPHKPSSELPFHISIYRARPDLRAVLHAHSPALVAFSAVRRIPNLDLIPSVRAVCPNARIAEYAVPGSGRLGENIGRVFAENCDIALLENHGVCIGASDLFTAFQRFETLNYAASLETLAVRAGKTRQLSTGDRRISETDCHLKVDSFIPDSRSSEELAARRDMIALIRRLYRVGLFAAAHGTCSVRLADGGFLITPSGFDRAYLEEEDLVLVRDGMKEAGKTPSRAVRLHELIYRNNPGIHAVLQAKPVHAMAFAVTDAFFDSRAIPESYVLLRNIKKLPFQEVYSNPEGLSRELNEVSPAVVVENDSVIVVGAAPLQAFDRLEVLESTAHAILNAFAIGQIVPIPDSEIVEIKKAFDLKD